MSSGGNEWTQNCQHVSRMNPTSHFLLDEQKAENRKWKIFEHRSLHVTVKLREISLGRDKRLRFTTAHEKQGSALLSCFCYLRVIQNSKSVLTHTETRGRPSWGEGESIRTLSKGLACVIETLFLDVCVWSVSVRVFGTNLSVWAPVFILSLFAGILSLLSRGVHVPSLAPRIRVSACVCMCLKGWDGGNHGKEKQ